MLGSIRLRALPGLFAGSSVSSASGGDYLFTSSSVGASPKYCFFSLGQTFHFSSTSRPGIKIASIGTAFTTAIVAIMASNSNIPSSNFVVCSLVFKSFSPPR